MKTRPLALWFGLVCAVTSAGAAPALATPLNPSIGTLGCEISNPTTLKFEASASPDSARDGRASFVVTCAQTQRRSIALLYSHRLKGAKPGSELTYDLYASASHAAIWGSGADGGPIPYRFSAGRPTTIYIYARIAPHQPTLATQFNDSIEIITLP